MNLQQIDQEEQALNAEDELDKCTCSQIILKSRISFVGQEWNT